MKKILLVSMAIACFGIGSAGAADLLPPVVDPPSYLPPLSQPADHADTTGWYLRGDVGYAWNKIHDTRYFQGSNATDAAFTTAKLRSSYSVGVGAGYKINKYLRTDLTLDYFGKADFRGSTTGSCRYGVKPGVGVGTVGGVPCTSSDSANVTRLSLLANAYVDLATYGRFTAYAGAGIGGTYVDWSDLKNKACTVANPTDCDPTFHHHGEKSWRFSYALMLGASVDIRCDLKADLGYRYMRTSGGKMFGFKEHGGPGYEDGFSSHEIRGGLRYSLGGCGEQEVYDDQPPPIMPRVYK